MGQTRPRRPRPRRAMRGRCSPVSGPLPEGLDQTLQEFSVLVGTAIAIIFAVFIG